MNRKIVLMITLLLLAPMVAICTWPASAQEEILKIGVLVPYNLPQGHASLGGAEGGALLAAREINATGGINIGGTKYKIRLYIEDECALPLDEGKAYNNTKKLLELGCKFIIGGFRTETTWKIIEAIEDWNEGLPDEEKVIYLINGASTDQLCSETVGLDYEGFKWLFRINPINSTMLFRNVLGFLQGYLIPKKLAPLYGGNVKFGYIMEKLQWTEGIAWWLENYGLGPNATFTYGIRPSAGTTNFVPYLEDLNNTGARLLFIAYTLDDAKYLIMQWRQYNYPFVIVGIDVFSQTSLWPIWTGGACEYEATLDFSGTRTPITPLAVKFWDNFVGNFSLPPPNPPAWPIYTAWGAYNAFLVIKKALETAGTLNSATIIEVLEGQETALLNGKGKFTTIHDVYTLSYGPIWPDGYTRAMMAQWVKKEDGSLVKEVVSPIDQLYSRKMKIPPWIYELADWDLNFDGVIDIRDVSAAGRAFGATPGTLRWNIEADINLDSVVDIRDISAIGRKFGRSGKPK
ncbi:MAG: ABC transporter substrate-binding protein [Candidatus Bathyarchaeia archaeon]